MENWSAKLEELVDEGDRRGAVKLLEDVIAKLQLKDGSETHNGLATALNDLAGFYEEDGLSMKADALRSSAIIIRQKAETTDGSGRPAVEEEEEDWERNDFELPSATAAAIAEGPKVELNASRQRGRGAFTYGGLYSDNRNFREEVNSNCAEMVNDERESYQSLAYGAGHVLVIDGFSPKTRTNDLELLLTSFMEKGVVIRWVNDTTALAVFRNPSLARQALMSIRNPLYKIRSYDEASEIHSCVCERELEPPAPRPPTSARAAQRMIVGALQKQGLRTHLQPKFNFTSQQLQQQEIERKKRLSLREKLRDEAWGSEDA